MKENYIPQNQRKKVLLLSDDIRMNSGIATCAREFVTGLAHKYNWAQLAGSIQHPEKGKIVDLCRATNTSTGLTDSYVRLYPTDGYGNADILNEVMRIEKPDVLLHFTDPKFWIWLYQIERELRQKIPIAYLNIWDNLPMPMYNRPFYESCDLLMSISRQTYNINKWVLGPENCQTINGELFNEKGEITSIKNSSSRPKVIIHYCPHGINTNVFKPLTNESELKDLQKVKGELFKKNYNFIIFYNNRNIRRKQTSTIMLAYRNFCENLLKEEAEKCVLWLHTKPLDEAGTDLPAVKEAFCKEYDVVFSVDKVPPERMNQYYNIADVTINLSDNEGFGLATAESIAAGTPIIVSATGGLQDQCGFVDENGNPPVFTMDWGTNSDGRYKRHGKWVTPIYPAARMMQGSIQTPYILADYAKWEDCAEAMMYWYTLTREKRKECGLIGRNWLMSEGNLNADYMCKTMREGLDAMLASWKGRERFNVHRHDEYVGHNMPQNKLGVILPKIDRTTILKKFNNLELNN